MKTFVRTSIIVLLGITLTGCTVTTKSGDVTLSERAWTDVEAGCVEYNNSDYSKAGYYFSTAARLNPQYLSLVENMNNILNPWVMGGTNIAKAQSFMTLFCASE
jgi:hypothetical protein